MNSGHSSKVNEGLTKLLPQKSNYFQNDSGAVENNWAPIADTLCGPSDFCNRCLLVLRGKKFLKEKIPENKF